MEGITSSCSTIGEVTYVRETVMVAVEEQADPRNSHESVIVSIDFNAQLTRSIDGYLLCVYSINIL